MPIMQALFPGHVPLTDIELFQLFNIEMYDEQGFSLGDLWNVEPRIGHYNKKIENLDAEESIDNAAKRAARVQSYADRVAAGLTLFEDEDE